MNACSDCNAPVHPDSQCGRCEKPAEARHLATPAELLASAARHDAEALDWEQRAVRPESCEGMTAERLRRLAELSRSLAGLYRAASKEAARRDLAIAQRAEAEAREKGGA